MRSNKIVIVLALCALLVAGCKKKKQVQTPPPAPTIAPSTTVAPAQPPQPQPPPNTQTGQQKTATVTPQKPPTKAKTKPRTAKKTPAPKPAPSTTTTAKVIPPPRITVEPGSLPDIAGGISASAPHSQETDERRTTAQLLQSTEDNLRAITRTLTDDEQATVTRIRSFMSQSQAATKDGDSVRAHNLALKAHLLSDELANR